QSIMHAKCNYWGLGVGGGADMLWHFTPHFGLYGELSLGILYGRFDVHRNGTSVFPTNTDIGTPFSFHFKKEMWRTRATIQTALGFEWETVFNRDRNRIAISLGYEFNEWFQQNQFVSSAFDSDSNIGNNGLPLNSIKFANADLAFKGGTLRATFNF
ncbi:MAG TPA: Lpg1974 family pore-forming outer membrane protein, partial [Rhabdochlamydiaceae bacterium]